MGFQARAGRAGKPLLNANGKPVLKKSYSVLQDDFFRYMRDTGYDDVERGERGSSEEHLTVTQFKVQQEQARLAELTEQNRQQEKQAATLGSKIEKSRISGSMCGLSKKSWQRPFPSHPKLPWSVRTLTDFPRWQRSTLQQRKRNQTAKGVGCGKQTDCKAQG